MNIYIENFLNNLLAEKGSAKNTIISYKKEDGFYTFAVDVDKLSISDFLSYLSSKISIDDVEIQNDNIDNIIVKLYKDFEI